MLKCVHFPVSKLCLRKREKGGRREEERGQEQEDIKYKPVNAMHTEALKGGAKRSWNRPLKYRLGFKKTY